jgi:hypothetical protein
VRYFYYAATMQAIAINLMSRKAMAAMRLEEGSVREAGLAAMGGGSDQVRSASTRSLTTAFSTGTWSEGEHQGACQDCEHVCEITASIG